MAVEIGLKEIPIFKYLDKSQTALLSQIFHAQTLKKDDIVLLFGKDVPGLYIVGDGEVTVFNAHYEANLAVLQRGGSFGEMSLIEDGQKSSATIKVTSREATLLFCSRGDFKTFLASPNEHIEPPFYKGAAEMLSSRLRATNEQVRTQIAAASNLLSDLLSASNVMKHLGKTRKDLIGTGDNVAGQLFSVVPELDALTQKHPELQGSLLKIQKKIEDLLVTETQNFDRISQQIDLIVQYLVNIQRVLSGEKPLDIKGDAHLFDKEP